LHFDFREGIILSSLKFISIYLRGNALPNVDCPGCGRPIILSIDDMTKTIVCVRCATHFNPITEKRIELPAPAGDEQESRYDPSYEPSSQPGSKAAIWATFAMFAVVALVVIVVAIFKFGENNSAEKSAQADKEKLQGTWKPVFAELAGQPAPEEIGALRLIFQGDQILRDYRGKLILSRSGEKATFKLDAKKSPKEIDFLGTKTEPGIYVFEGERLKICTAVQGAPRPKEFTTRPGVMHMLFVLERQEP
jgi:uncharacterized protein (TIGR03067 family)